MKVKIKCPKCGETVMGNINPFPGIPFFNYYGHCEKCNYDITESEFEEIK